MDSRLLDNTALTSPQLAKALENAMPKLENAMLRGHLVSGRKVHSIGITDTSVNPAWRKAYVHIIGTGVGVPNIGSLKELTKDSGAYSNEVNKQNYITFQNFITDAVCNSVSGAKRTGNTPSGAQTMTDFQRLKPN
jgi:hypothetical protein